MVHLNLGLESENNSLLIKRIYTKPLVKFSPENSGLDPFWSREHDCEARVTCWRTDLKEDRKSAYSLASEFIFLSNSPIGRVA